MLWQVIGFPSFSETEKHKRLKQNQKIGLHQTLKISEYQRKQLPLAHLYVESF